MTHPRRLVSVGNVIIDITARVPALPERGGDVVAQESSVLPGGSFNTLVAAVRQRLPSAYAGASGTGPFADLARSGLREHGIEVLLPASPGEDTGYDVAIVEPDGERRFVTAFGAEATLSANQLDSVAIRAGDIIHVSGYGLLRRTNADVIPAWLLGLPPELVVLLDPGPLVSSIARETLLAVLKRADWVSCNAREAWLLTGDHDPRRSAETLAGYGCGVVVRLGPDGCVISDDDETVSVAGFPSEVMDTTGAGDAHVGAYLAALAVGHGPVVAARRANACAAIAVTRSGPATAPDLLEVEALLARVGRVT